MNCVHQNDAEEKPQIPKSNNKVMGRIKSKHYSPIVALANSTPIIRWKERFRGEHVIMKPNAAKHSSCKAREAVWSNWAVKCSQVNRDFFPKYDIVCQDYELLLRSLRSN